MGALRVVVNDPGIQIGLQALQVRVELFAEGHVVELLQDGLVEL